MGNRSKLIILLVVVPLVIFLWPSSVGGKTDFFIVQGKSMLPTILPGSFIITQQESSYAVDDVVAYKYDQESTKQIVVHRIIEYNAEDRDFILQGDNNPKRDAGTYTNEEIIGEVKAVVPFVGDALSLMRNPVILIVLVGISAIWQMEQSKKKKKKEELRKRRLGLSPQTKQDSLAKKRPKKQSYTLFFAAMGMNILIFIGNQTSISSGIMPEGDALTGFLFKLLEPSIATTVTFFIYFMGIIGLYFIAKRYEVKTSVSQQKALKRGLVLKKKSSGMVIAAHIFWTLFLLVGFLYLITIWGDFLPIPN
ncbi:MAG: signal peptidase I [Nitrosopumilus sp.]|nr:signal peptidase I [Nitrosopumilus sp.]